jgi:hypothetical protein
VTDFPLLCISSHCRTAERGGPRRTERAWFCPTCIDNAADDLRFIADAWADLEDALMRPTGPAGEPIKGSRDVGLILNERASRARTAVAADLWAFARIILEWGDDQGRTLTGPADQTIPGLARWIANWHLSVFTVHAGRLTALSFIDDVTLGRRAVKSAAYPLGTRKVETGLRCTEHADSPEGERTPCTGEMCAWVTPRMSALPDLVCSEDETHRIDPATWQRAGWKRAATNAAGIGRLAAGLDLTGAV